MAFLDPYAVDGATVTGAHLRRETFRNTKGETGVDEAAALKVIAVPGSPGVAGIAPGGGVIAVESRRESYSVTNLAMDGDALVDIPAAGSGGATHFVVIEVTDPEYHGQEPGTTARVVSSLAGLTRPHLVLARVRLSAGEAFTTTSVVEDLRHVALAREWRRLFTRNLTGATVYALTNTGAGQAWPDSSAGEWQVDIPEWATHVNVKVTYGGVRVSYSGSRGAWWVRLGSSAGPNIRTQDQVWSLDTSVEPGREVRETWSMGDALGVPESLRGTRQDLQVLGRMINTGGPPRLDNASSVMVDIQFTEGPA